jgi:hypothetical protein
MTLTAEAKGFVEGQPKNLAPAKVIAAAKKANLALTTADVFAARGRKMPGRKPNKRRAVTRSVKSGATHTAAAAHAGGHTTAIGGGTRAQRGLAALRIMIEDGVFKQDEAWRIAEKVGYLEG